MVANVQYPSFTKLSRKQIDHFLLATIHFPINRNQPPLHHSNTNLTMAFQHSYGHTSNSNGRFEDEMELLEAALEPTPPDFSQETSTDETVVMFSHPLPGLEPNLNGLRPYHHANQVLPQFGRVTNTPRPSTKRCQRTSVLPTLTQGSPFLTQSDNEEDATQTGTVVSPSNSEDTSSNGISRPAFASSVRQLQICIAVDNARTNSRRKNTRQATSTTQLILLEQ
jgi:hypothetical protein